MYEDLGDEEKLLGILMIASHLKRTDWDMWVKTGNLAVKLKDYRIAIHCISKGEEIVMYLYSEISINKNSKLTKNPL